MQIRLSRAKRDDCELIWKWRNDPITRKNFFYTPEVSLNTHKKWFTKALENGERRIYLIKDHSGNKLGVVWFDMNRYCNQAEIGVNLASFARDKGIGTMALKLASEKAFTEWNVDKICAQIKGGNHASRYAFSKAGFGEVGVIVEKYKNGSSHS